MGSPHDQEPKMQSKPWKHPGSPPSKKFKRAHSVWKVMASIFWDSQGVIMIDYLEQGCTINSANFAGKLRWLRQEIARKRRGKLTCSVLLLQDNASANTSQVAMTAATECGFEILLHPPDLKRRFRWYLPFNEPFALQPQNLLLR